MRFDFDAVVIGGGPAGALSALLLARMGWRVALFEKGPRHRIKTCGHCLNARVLQILKRHDLAQEVLAIADGATSELRVGAFGIATFRLPIADGIIVERSRFDQLLRDKAADAGALVLHETSARIIQSGQGENQVEVRSLGSQQELTCSLVIGADGLGSRCARNAGLLGNGRTGQRFGFSFDLVNRELEGRHPRAISMFLTNHGYLGAVLQGNRLHLGGLVTERRSQRNGEPFDFTNSVARQHRLANLDQITAADAQNFSAIGPMPWRPANVANDSVVLVGDSAGYVEPFTGEGISWALLAAETLRETVRSISPGRWSQHIALCYSESWQRQLEKRQRICRWISPILQRPLLTRAVFHAGNRAPWVSRQVIRRVMVA